MADQNDIAFVVFEVLDVSKGNAIVHRHRIEAPVPTNESQRISLTSLVAGEVKKLNQEYAFQRYIINEVASENYVPLRTTLTKSEFGDDGSLRIIEYGL